MSCGEINGETLTDRVVQRSIFSEIACLFLNLGLNSTQFSDFKGVLGKPLESKPFLKAEKMNRNRTGSQLMGMMNKLGLIG